MNRTSSSQRHLPGIPARSGCGFLLVVCFFSCVFLLINGMLVAGFAPALLRVSTWLADKNLPKWLSGPRIAQIVVFVLPVLLVFAEWALVDWIVDRISALEKPAPRNDSK